MSHWERRRMHDAMRGLKDPQDRSAADMIVAEKEVGAYI
jgi:hypothetical protein